MRRSIALLVVAIVLVACGGSAAEVPATTALAPSPTPTASSARQPTQPVVASSSPLATPVSAVSPAGQALPGTSGAPTARSSSTPAATATLVPTPAPPPLAPMEGSALVEALKHGGYIIYFRHASTDLSQNDTDPKNLTNCATQRNLNEQGRSEARAIGSAIRALEIPIEQVLSSEYCRALETANLAFGRAEPNVELTGYTGLDDGERQRRIEALRQMLSVPPAPGTNTVLVSHQFNLLFAVNVTLEAEGEAAIFRPDGSHFSLVARILPGEWETLGR